MIDLHIHTNNSDGQYDVTTILREAETKKLKTISIADHNTANAYNQIDDISKYFSGKLITGIEIDFLYNGKIMHMLGYNIDVAKISKEEYLIKNKMVSSIEKENEFLEFFKQVCTRLNILYTPNLKVIEKQSFAQDVLKADIIRYEANKDILNKLDIIDGNFYRVHMSNPKSPFFIDWTKGKEDIYTVAKIIKDAGGICFLAHPFDYKIENVENFINEVCTLNIIDGIECYHKAHTKENTDFLIKYCNERNLLKSGGSDFHNDSHFMGYGDNGSLEIEDNIICDWE